MAAINESPNAARRRRAWQLYAQCVDLGADAATAALLDLGALFALRGRLMARKGLL